jgi:hypothetical protein
LGQPATTRPDPVAGLSAAEFARWYWTKAEVVAFARTLGVATSGDKAAVTARIIAALSGGDPRDVKAQRPVRTHVAEPLGPATVIPDGVVLSRTLRDWFVTQVGPSFRFNGQLRWFLRHHPGATLGDALDHYRATAGDPGGPIGQQFEYNRFTRQWADDHPGATAAEIRAAWWRHRSTPTDQRQP